MSQSLAAGATSYCDALLQLKEVLQELRPAVAEAVQATAAAAQQQKRQQKQQHRPQHTHGEQQPSMGKDRQQQLQQEQLGEAEESSGDTQVLRPLDVAQLQLCLAFAAVSLYHSYLRTQGQDVEKHPVVRDLARVRVYMKKVATRLEEDRRGGAAAGRSLSVNSTAAKRLLRFYTRRPAA